MNIWTPVKLSEKWKKKYLNLYNNPHNEIWITVEPNWRKVNWVKWYNSYFEWELEVVDKLPDTYIVKAEENREIKDYLNEKYNKDFASWIYYIKDNKLIDGSLSSIQTIEETIIISKEAFLAIIKNQKKIPKSFWVPLEWLSLEEKKHLIDIVYSRVTSVFMRKDDRNPEDMNNNLFWINKMWEDFHASLDYYDTILTREEFLDLFPLPWGESKEEPKVIKNKWKTKNDYLEENKKLKEELNSSETEIANLKVSLDNSNLITKALSEEVEKLKKKLTPPKPKKLSSERWKAWDDIIISDKNYNLLQFSFKSKQPLLLRWPSWTGKSSMVRALWNDVGVNVVEFNFNGDTTVEHLLGHKILVNGTMSWEDWPLTDAVRNGKIFIWHELNASSPEIQFILNWLLELNQGQLWSLSVQWNNWEVIVPHKDFRFYWTYNPWYLGTKMFWTSIMSRFVGIDIPPLSIDEEKELLLRRYPKQIWAIDILVNLEHNLRAKKDFVYDISTRDILQCLLFIDWWFSIDDSVTTCIYNSIQLDIEKDLLMKELEALKGT